MLPGGILAHPRSLSAADGVQSSVRLWTDIARLPVCLPTSCLCAREEDCWVVGGHTHLFSLSRPRPAGDRGGCTHLCPNQLYGNVPCSFSWLPFWYGALLPDAVFVCSFKSGASCIVDSSDLLE